MDEQQEFQNIPLLDLYESKTNPRRQENAAALKELTESVRDRGVLVPLLARPVDGKFEIVAGSRRYQAAKEAGLKTVPVFVHSMTDTAASEIQIIENLQREDVHPLDEGFGYRALVEKSKLDVPAIAKKVGKSASYVYQRLKLSDLSEPVQKAFHGGRITAGHAILIARLQPRDQVPALKATCPDWVRNEDPPHISVRKLDDWIFRELFLSLNGAPFKMGDPNLVPAAGTCNDCPKQTSKNKDLFSQVRKKDVCTDPGCFNEKVEALIERHKAQAEKANETLISISTEYDYEWEKKKEKRKPGAPISSSEWTVAKSFSCQYTKKGVVVKGNDRGKALNVCDNLACKVHHGRSAGSSKWAAPSAEEIRRREQEEVKRTIRRQLFKAVVNKTPAKFGRKDLELVAAALLREIWQDNRKKVIEMLGWAENKKPGARGTDYERVGAAKILKLSPLELGQFIVALSLARDLEVTGWGDNGKVLRAVAKRYRVDEAKIIRTVKLELDARRKAKAQRDKKRQAAEKAAKPKPIAKRKTTAPAKKAKAATPRKKWRRQRGSWVQPGPPKKKAAKAKKR